MKKYVIAIFLGLLLFGVRGANANITWDQIMGQIRNEINDVPDPKVRYSNTFLLALFRRGLEQMVADTLPIEETQTITLSAGTTFYSLSVTNLGIEQVRLTDTTGRVRILEQKSMKALYQDNPDWQRQSGPPMYYFVQSSTIASVDPTAYRALQIGVTPVPSTATALGTLSVQYLSLAGAISTVDSIPFNQQAYMQPYQFALVEYVVAQIKLIENDLPGYTAHMQIYKDTVAAAKVQLGSMPDYNPGFRPAVK